ncbi:MAG: plastocyanin/azurin family copper-binding protein [Rhodospirillaceae bacterium]
MKRTLHYCSAAVLFAAAIAVSAPVFAGAGQPGHGHGADAKPGHHMMPGSAMMKGGEHMDNHMGGPAAGNPAIGQPGKASDVSRDINVVLQDIYFEPGKIAIKAGETVRFKIVNQGTLLHEFALGTAQSHAAHKKMMAMMLEHGMIEADRINHDRMKMNQGDRKNHMDHMHGPESGSVLVEPGKSAEMIWTFPKETTLEFACTIPGHYEAGMVGPLTVR